MNENNIQTESHPSPPVTTTDPAPVNNKKTKASFHHIFLYAAITLFLITILIALFLTIKAQLLTPAPSPNTL